MLKLILDLIFLAPNVGDRFKSPVVTAIARRQLAFDSGDVSPQGSPVSRATIQGKKIYLNQEKIIDIWGPKLHFLNL